MARREGRPRGPSSGGSPPHGTRLRAPIPQLIPCGRCQDAPRSGALRREQRAHPRVVLHDLESRYTTPTDKPFWRMRRLRKTARPKRLGASPPLVQRLGSEGRVEGRRRRRLLASLPWGSPASPRSYRGVGRAHRDERGARGTARRPVPAGRVPLNSPTREHPNGARIPPFDAKPSLGVGVRPEGICVPRFATHKTAPLYRGFLVMGRQVQRGLPPAQARVGEGRVLTGIRGEAQRVDREDVPDDRGPLASGPAATFRKCARRTLTQEPRASSEVSEEPRPVDGRGPSPRAGIDRTAPSPTRKGRRRLASPCSGARGRRTPGRG